MQALIMKCVGVSYRIHGGMTSSVASISVHDSSVNNAAATSLQTEAARDFTSGKALSFIMAVSFHSCLAPLLKDGRVPTRDKQHTSVIHSPEADVQMCILSFPFKSLFSQIIQIQIYNRNLKMLR